MSRIRVGGTYHNGKPGQGAKGGIGGEEVCVYRGGRKNRYMGKARPATMASRACSLERRWSGLVG